jgi:teichuronic acid exporter
MTVKADHADDPYGHVSSGRSRKAIHGVLWSIVSTIVPSMVSMVVFLITSRALQPADFGLVAFAAGIVTVIGAVAPTGFATALVQRAQITRDHLNAVFWLGATGAALLFAIACVTALPIAHFFGNELLVLLIPVLGLKIVFLLLGVVPSALLSRSMQFRKLSIRTTIASLLGASACLALLYAGYGIWALVASQLVSTFATFVGSFLTARWLPQFSFRFSALRELFHFGGFASATSLVSSLSIDDVLIGSFLGTHSLGQFNFARRIFLLMTDVMSGPLNAVSLSLLSSLQGEPAKRREIFSMATFLSALVSFPAFVGLAAIADLLVPAVFGAQWLEAVPVLRAFCAIGMLASIGVLQYSLISSRGRADVWFYYILAKQILTAACIVVFYQSGVGVLATALAIQTYVVWLPSAYVVSRLLGINILAYLATFLVPAVASLVLFGAVEAVRMHTGDWDMYPRLALCIAGGATAYLLTVSLLAQRQLRMIWSTIATLRGYR